MRPEISMAEPPDCMNRSSPRADGTLTILLQFA
jgi:hypothetical protein